MWRTVKAMHIFLMTAWLLANGGDAATSHLALRQPLVYHETNPILPQNPIANSATMMAEAAGGAFLLDRLHRHHPKLANVLLIAGISVEAAQTMKNVHTLMHP